MYVMDIQKDRQTANPYFPPAQSVEDLKCHSNLSAANLLQDVINIHILANHMQSISKIL